MDWLLDPSRNGAVTAFGWTVLFGAMLELVELFRLMELLGATTELIVLVWLMALLVVESEALGLIVGWILDLAMVGVATGLIAELGRTMVFEAGFVFATRVSLAA